jgi:hypothetical protein
MQIQIHSQYRVAVLDRDRNRFEGEGEKQGEGAAETSADLDNLRQRKKLSSFCMGSNSARDAPLVDSDSEFFPYGVHSLAKVRLIQRFFFNFMLVTPTRPVYLCVLAFFLSFFSLLTCVCVRVCV